MSNKNKDYNELRIYTEVSLMAQELRFSIGQMKRCYRFDVGDEIRQILRQIKYTISDIHQKPNSCKYGGICDLINLINHLEIALNDCLEDNALSLSGRYNIFSPLQRLDSIKQQADDWRTYIYDKYNVQEV